MFLDEQGGNWESLSSRFFGFPFLTDIHIRPSLPLECSIALTNQRI
jgi:hypothetical protein